MRPPPPIPNLLFLSVPHHTNNNQPEVGLGIYRSHPPPRHVLLAGDISGILITISIYLYRFYFLMGTIERELLSCSLIYCTATINIRDCGRTSREPTRGMLCHPPFVAPIKRSILWVQSILRIFSFYLVSEHLSEGRAVADIIVLKIATHSLPATSSWLVYLWQ